MVLKSICLAGICLLALRAAEEPAASKIKAARSVHLGYPIPAPPGGTAECDRFYIEVTVEQSTPGSYFMCAGFRSGYCGIQELGNGKKIVIFSVWDPGQQNNPNALKAEDRVKVLEQGEGVQISRFGGEGTGGKSIFPYEWKLGETVRFMLSSKADDKSSTFSASVFLNDKKEWKRLATFQTTAQHTNFKGLYSFVEDFRRDGRSATEVRRARYGNGWVRTLDGQWHSLLQAKFTGDATPTENNDAGVSTEGDFYLATGGAVQRTHPLNALIERPSKNDARPELPE